MGEGSFESAFPTVAILVNVRAATGKFSRWINLHTLGGADDSNQRSFCHHLTAAHTSALGNMFGSLDWFLGHLSFSKIFCTGLLIPIPTTISAAVLFADDDRVAVGVVLDLSVLFLLLTLFLLFAGWNYFAFFFVFEERFIHRR